MSGQLLELLIFAGIAIFLINKLISMLGSTSEDEPSKRWQNSTFFDNSDTNAANKHIDSVALDISKNDRNLTLVQKLDYVSYPPEEVALLSAEDQKEIIKGLITLRSKSPNFNLIKFYNNSQLAFQLIIEAGIKNDEEVLSELIDPRYIGRFKNIASSYTDLTEIIQNIKSTICEIDMFGNTAFIKVRFTHNKSDGHKIPTFHEEWTFSRNILSNSNTWYLSDIEKA